MDIDAFHNEPKTSWKAEEGGARPNQLMCPAT
jgi:hypothetical protein